MGSTGDSKENCSQEMILKLYLVTLSKTLEIFYKLTHRQLGALLQDGPRASFLYVDVTGGILRWKRGEVAPWYGRRRTVLGLQGSWFSQVCWP